MTRFFQHNKLAFVFFLSAGLASCSFFSPAAMTKDADDEELFRKEVVDYAKKYVGSGYKYAGRSPKGFDCSGFTHFVLNRYDISVSVSSRAQEKEGRSVPVKAAKTGDLIFFRRSKLGQVFHVAMVVSNDTEGLQVIHSTSSRGVVIDNISHSSYWKPKISSARDVISK